MLHFLSFFNSRVFDRTDSTEVCSIIWKINNHIDFMQWHIDFKHERMKTGV